MYMYERVLNVLNRHCENGCDAKDVMGELNISKDEIRSSVNTLRRIGFNVRIERERKNKDTRYFLVKNDSLMQDIKNAREAKKKDNEIKNDLVAQSDDINTDKIRRVITMIKKSGSKGVSSKKIKEVFNLHKKNQIKVLIQYIKKRGVNIVNIAKPNTTGIYVIKKTFGKTATEPQVKTRASKNIFFMCPYEKITSHYRFKPQQNALIESVFR